MSYIQNQIEVSFSISFIYKYSFSLAIVTLSPQLRFISFIYLIFYGKSVKVLQDYPVQTLSVLEPRGLAGRNLSPISVALSVFLLSC